MRYRVWLRMAEVSWAPLGVDATNEAEAFEKAQAKAWGLGIIEYLDWMRDELNVEATSDIEPVSEAELVAPRFELSDKASCVWAALQALTAQGFILSHQNVQQWLALNTLGGMTVSPRHYRRIKRLFCERSGLAG